MLEKVLLQTLNSAALCSDPSGSAPAPLKLCEQQYSCCQQMSASGLLLPQEMVLGVIRSIPPSTQTQHFQTLL